MLVTICEGVQASLPYSSAGSVTVLYIRILVLGWTSLHSRIDSTEKNVLLAIYRHIPAGYNPQNQTRLHHLHFVIRAVPLVAKSIITLFY
jgi:hypothetical protein